ncbi:MAG: hypothetical protein ACYSSI_10800 [Planctomycetota bacterium]|jgi:hypothetical protein
MSGSARIESIEALKDLRTFLCNFAKKISVAIDEAESDVLRTLNWLKNDRHPYWKSQLRIRNEQLVKAKHEFKQKKYFEQSIGSGSSCVDERKALAAAQKRFDEAQDKLNKVRNWIPKLEKESYACRGALRGLANFVCINLPNTRTQIDQMIYALESYVGVATPLMTTHADDEMLAYANKADYKHPRLADMEQLCKDLRRRNPLKNLPSELPTGKPLLHQFKQFTVSNEILEVLKKGKKDNSHFSKKGKLIFDDSIENSDYIYIENFKGGSDADIKGYIGPVKQNETTGCSVCRIPDFLKNYPNMEEILSLPAGWLVVLKNKQLEAVFNADNKLIIHIPTVESV